MYSVTAYYASKIFVDLPIFIIIPLLVSLITYFGIGFTLSWVQYLKFVVSLSFEIQCATAYGYLISCSIQDPSTAAIVAPVIVQPILLLGGFYANIGELAPWMRIFTYLSPVYYNFQNLVYNEWGEVNSRGGENTLSEEHQEFVQFLGFEDTYRGVLTKMIILICIVHILALIFLHLLKRRFQ